MSPLAEVQKQQIKLLYFMQQTLLTIVDAHIRGETFPKDSTIWADALAAINSAEWLKNEPTN